MANEKIKSYLVLARKYRPQRFDEIIGQQAISSTLKKSINTGKIASAYLFSGQRGVGKTSMARIFAKALNCEKGPTTEPCGECARCRSIAQGGDLDVIEIDGATYTRVDDVRELQEGISHLPYMARYKVYIIDEVHMLSTAAFNALLKTLEEPPQKVVFIFATTEPEKIPETIKSRCQHYHFEPVSPDEVSRHLERIIENEGIRIPDQERVEVIESIVKASEGSVRDALVTLEQLAVLGDGEIRFDFCQKLLGIVETTLLFQTLDFLRKKNTSALLRLVYDLVKQGRDLERFVRHFIYFLRDLLIIKSGGDEKLVGLSSARLKQLQSVTEELGFPFLLNTMNTFLRMEEEMKTSGLPRFVLEFHLIKLTAIEPAIDLDRFIIEFDKHRGVPSPRTSEHTRELSTGPGTTPAEISEKKNDLLSIPESAEETTDVDTQGYTPEKESFKEEETPPETKADIKTQEPVDESTQLWAKFREKVGQKYPFLDSALEDCTLYDQNNSTITIGVINHDAIQFNYRILEKNINVLSRVLEDIVGKPYNMRLVKIEPDVVKEPALEEEVHPDIETAEVSSPDYDVLPVEEEMSANMNEELMEQISKPEAEELGTNADTLLSQNPDLQSAVTKILKVFKGKIIEPKKKK
ncbi:DNA polymerase III subunit gamma/tau [Candidatus Sumerlaeota bacterium]|nr:DNA polymerase III subunit gamma/tau [Candidatus Sumerlaeota bacterium]